MNDLPNESAPISVITPYFNESSSILKTLEMHRNQELPPKEVLLIDSGSTDGTSEVIDRWIVENQSRSKSVFKNIRARTGVPSSSKNVGIKNSTQEFVAFMDCGLRFPAHWLKSHLEKLRSSGAEIIHSVGVFRGEDALDRAAIAQTYGYERPRPTVPGSLIRKSVFDKTGYFLDLRAGYDAHWLRQVRRLSLRRVVNFDVEVEYMGRSYTSGFSHLFKKTVLYAQPCVGLPGYWYPYVYCVLPFALLGVFVISPLLGLLCLLAYLILRGFVMPWVKSRNASIFTKIPWSVFYLPAAGAVMDFGKWYGYVRGILIPANRKRTDAQSNSI